MFIDNQIILACMQFMIIVGVEIFTHHMATFYEISVVIPKGTPLPACSATVTHSIRQEVAKSLEIVNCDFISLSPGGPNIFYEICPRTDLDSDMKHLLKSLQELKNSAPCVIVYCCTLDMCASMYAHSIMS